MMEKVLSRSIRLICLGSVTLGMHAAYAQTTTTTTEAPMQRVEVTGSRIRQVDLETAQPVTVVTQEQIQKSGLITVGDILNNLTSAGAPDFSRGQTLGSSKEQGGQFISLRNLGSNRVLVLVDGKRWTATVDGYTDLSTIPSAFIDHIDIVKDGGSSIYGSDAITGVVNVILKKTMEGGTLSGYMGQNDKGDGKNRDFSVNYGTSTDKTSLMFGFQHAETGAVFAKDRDITNSSYGPNHYDAGFGTGPYGRIRQVSPTGGATGFSQAVNHTGSYDGRGINANSRNLANYHTYTGANEDLYNSSQDMMFQGGSQVDNLFTKGSVELPWNMRFTTTALYSDRKSVNQAAGYPLNSLSQPNFPVYLDRNSYYNPYGASAVGNAAAQDLFFYRRTIEVPRVTKNDNKTVHIDATLGGDFTLAGKSFNWDIGYNHSAISGNTVQTGNLNLVNLKKAVGPSFLNAAGTVQCGTAAAPIAAADCVPFNILGGPSGSTAAGLGYIMSTGQASYGSSINSATANINGELFNMPGKAGAVGFAAGLEHRTVSGYDSPGQFEQSGYSTDLAGNSTYGRYTVKEAYLEVAIPLLKDLPFAQMLSIDLATRHSDYSNFGVTNNSKASFQWKPTKDLLARGTYAEGFRAPSVGDTFGGGSQTYDVYLDPCDSRFGEASRNAGVASRCAAAGAGANFRQLNQSGVAITGAGGVQGAYPFNAGAGNASLQPETAKTKTLGLVYNPSFLPGVSAGVDWYRVDINNRITGVTATYVANQCYIEGVGSFCSSIKRDPVTGEITTLSRGNANLGQLQVSGADMTLGYRLPRSQYGQFTLRSETTFATAFKVKSAADADWQNYAGEYYYNKIKSNLTLDWDLGNWSATWTARFQSKTKDQCWDVDVECSNPTGLTTFGTGYNQLGSVTYNDVSVGYKLPWKGKILVGANNVLDKAPRISYNGASSSSAVDADKPIDRFVYVRYNQAF
ncbi:MAG: TonB-dependent receptor [Pseudomonadota bacterium]|nr:TonB-dependent receptor [Pseudomonadota bacterium]